MNEVREIVRRFISDHIVMDAESLQISDELNLKESGILDSLSTLKLVSFLEKQFGIDIEATDLEEEKLQSISSIEKLVSSKVDAQA